MIGYETAWTQTRKDLIRVLESLKEEYENIDEENYPTPKFACYYKIDGLQHAVDIIEYYHKKYHLCTHENAVPDEDSRRMFCPDCGARFYDCSI